MAIGSDSETVISRGDERPPATERKTKKKPPKIPRANLGSIGSNFSDNTSKYLGSVYTEYVREMDEPTTTGVKRGGGEASDLALEMQHEFNMKLAETIQREQDRDTPVYAEVRAEKKSKKRRSYDDGSRKSDLFASEDIDATIDAAFKATFEDEDRHMSPVMGTEAVLEKKKKREEKDKDRKGGRQKERQRGEKEKSSGQRKERRSEPSKDYLSKDYPSKDHPSKDYLRKDYSSKDRRMSKDSDTTIEASHHITVEVLLFSLAMIKVDFKVDSSGQHFVDTIEELKSSDEEERRPARARRGDGNGSRRSSIYFDESDGPFGTWKRVKLDK